MTKKSRTHHSDSGGEVQLLRSILNETKVQAGLGQLELSMSKKKRGEDESLQIE